MDLLGTKRLVILIAVIAATWLLLYYTWLKDFAFNIFAQNIGDALLVIGIFFLIDKFLLTKIDTHEEIFVKKNVAAGLFYIAIAIVIGFCFIN